MQHGFNGRQVSPVGREFGDLRLSVLPSFDDSADAMNVGGIAAQSNAEELRSFGFDLSRPVFPDESGLIYVVHDHVEIAVVIEVGPGHTVGEAGHIPSPVDRLIRKGQVAVVPEEVVACFHRWEFEQQVAGGSLCGLVAVCDEIIVGDIFRQAVGHAQVEEAIEVQVCKERRPAPVGVGRASHECDL